MSSSSADNKLLMTAVGAALGGAAVSFAAFKYLAQKKELAEHKEALFRNMVGPSLGARPSFHSMEDMMQRSDSILLPHQHEEKMRRRIAARVAVEEDNLTPRNSVTVRVPATSANMGPGCEYCVNIGDLSRLSDVLRDVMADCLPKLWILCMYSHFLS